jgi:hypothetical protein
MFNLKIRKIVLTRSFQTDETLPKTITSFLLIKYLHVYLFSTFAPNGFFLWSHEVLIYVFVFQLISSFT